MKPQAQQPNSKSSNIAPNHTHKLGNKQFAMYLKSQPKLSTLTYNIQKYLSSYEPFYYNAFLSLIKGRDLDTLEKLLNQQYSKLMDGKSFLQRINGAIFSRNKCLQKIKRDLSKVQAVLIMFKKSYFRKQNQQDNIYLQYTGEQGYTTVQIDQTIQGSIQLINNLFLDMSRFRNMTIYIIQTIHRWRIEVQQWMDRCQCHSRVDYYLKSEDQNGNSVRFYDIVQHDTDFIWNSKLSQHIWMEFKNDPLLIRNVVNVSERPQKQILQKYFVQILYPNTEQVIDKSIKTLDMLRYVYKPRQINLYEEQEKLIQNYLSLQRQKNEEIGFENQDKDDDPNAISFINKLGRSRNSRIKNSQSQSKISVKKQFRNQIQHDQKNWQEGSPYLTKSRARSSPKNPIKLDKSDVKQSPRGWIFGKQLKKPATDKIRDIIKKHQVQMNYLKNHKGIIKPFNITNVIQKKSIALAYLSQKNNMPIKSKEDGWIFGESQRAAKRTKRKKQGFNSQNQDQLRHIQDNKQAMENSRRKMHQSLVRINSIIQQDPKENDVDQQTPKNNSNKKKMKQLKQEINKNKFFINQKQKVHTKTSQQNKQLSKTIDKKDMKNQQKTSRKLLQSGIKINSLVLSNQKGKDQQMEAQIQVQQQQTPLNFKQFFQVFRADTKQKGFAQSRASNHLTKSTFKKQEVKQLAGSISVKKIIDRKRAQSLKNPKLLPYYNQNKKKIPKNKQKSINKQKSENSFKSYNKVALQKSINEASPNQQVIKKNIPLTIIQDKQFLNLRTKQITKDMINKYLNHIIKQLPVSSQSFTNYHTQAYFHNITKILSDSTINSLIFDIEAQKDGKIGQAIVIQTLSSTLKMRYTIQFINVQKFQLYVSSICKISQQLLSTSPCQQVVLKLMQDKADPVSLHFIDLIDNSLKKKTQKFCYFHILQKKALGLSHQNLYQRVYVFQGKTKNLIKQAINQKYSGEWRKRLAGSSYRSLIFNTTCLALTSNFKLRSQNLNKPMIQIYRQQSIGILYTILLHKIMTKYHLKQLKIASVSVNDADQTTGLVKKSPFLRSIFYGLLQLIKKTSDQKKGVDVLNLMRNSTTTFKSMTDLLNYLSYKQYDQIFKFDFLVQSRFILNHQLTVSELNLSASLDFVIQNSANMLILNNYHNFIIHEVDRSNNQKADNSIDQIANLNGYLLPTTEDNLKIFFMSARQYLQCSDYLDLYSYLQLLFRQSKVKQRHDIKQIAIPNLTKRKNKVNPVKMYDGFLRLFPQRQFYSSSTMKVQNLWENYYPNGIITMPDPDAVIIQYPIIIGFYDSILEQPIVSYCLKQQKQQIK